MTFNGSPLDFEMIYNMVEQRFHDRIAALETRIAALESALKPTRDTSPIIPILNTPDLSETSIEYISPDASKSDLRAIRKSRSYEDHLGIPREQSPLIHSHSSNAIVADPNSLWRIEQGIPSDYAQDMHIPNLNPHTAPIIERSNLEDEDIDRFLSQKDTTLFYTNAPSKTSIIALRNNGALWKGFIWEKKGNRRIAVENTKDIKKTLGVLLNIDPDVNLVKVRDSKMEFAQQLAKIHERNIQRVYKFGVILRKSAQNESEMYSNGEATEDFNEFLEFLGDQIVLKGWNGFKGRLDTRFGITGEEIGSDAEIWCIHDII
eukprot:TRINITY_DN8303_c0_g1_i1.p1 TRINITY_DN8303_c0_g1~~TRINITY_DN8303_c0_g1_i1.p1  ORF type:complete len:319 (-),score=96.58 TRINITY_DN8303_c0_g1_i1:16-972(-)